MNQIEVEYDKKFLKEKRKFKRKCTSIEKDFKRFEIALKIKIMDNNFKVPVDNKKICRIEGLHEWLHCLYLLSNLFTVKK